MNTSKQNLKVYMWDHYEEPPMKELLNKARINPNLKTWNLVTGGTLSLVTFARNKKDALNNFQDFLSMKCNLEEVQPVW